MPLGFRRVLFFWAASLALALAGYGLLWLVLPDPFVFGDLVRMHGYHHRHPVAYIAIPCFFYGLVAGYFADAFARHGLGRQLALTWLIVALVVLFSSPLGGALYFYHDMQAGYFPEDWGRVLLTRGVGWGGEGGWLIVLLSFPYNVLGVVVCFYLTRWGSYRWRPASPALASPDPPFSAADPA